MVITPPTVQTFASHNSGSIPEALMQVVALQYQSKMCAEILQVGRAVYNHLIYVLHEERLSSTRKAKPLPSREGLCEKRTITYSFIFHLGFDSPTTHSQCYWYKK